MSDRKPLHPIWIALAAGLLVVALAAGVAGWQTLNAPPPGSASGPPDPALPWSVQLTGNGTSRVFGLTLGEATLADVEQRFGDELQLGLVARIDEAGALEALVDPLRAGFVTGRLVIGFEASVAQLTRWRERADGSEVMEGGTRRFKLGAGDRDEARRQRVRSLAFIPGVRLTEADVRTRFGEPGWTQAQGDGVVALGYPHRGVLALVQPGRRGVLQYVAPGQFERVFGPRPPDSSADGAAAAASR